MPEGLVGFEHGAGVEKVAWVLTMIFRALCKILCVG